MTAQRIRELTLSLSQHRIERDIEFRRRAEEDIQRAEHERRLQRELLELSGGLQQELVELSARLNSDKR